MERWARRKVVAWPVKGQCGGECWPSSPARDGAVVGAAFVAATVCSVGLIEVCFP